MGQILNMEEPFNEPRVIYAETDGMVMGPHTLPLTRQGDCVMVLVRPFSL